MTDSPPHTTIAEIFAADPLDLTKSDIHLVVQYLRSKRHQFVAGNKAAGAVNAPTPKTPTAKAAAGLAGQLSLKDLGL